MTRPAARVRALHTGLSFPGTFVRILLKSLLVPCLLPGLFLGGCAGRDEAPAQPPSVSLATEGPPLALVGEYGGMRLEGFMDRNCMAGYGSIGLRSIGQSGKGDFSVDIPELPDPPAPVEESGKKPARPQPKPARTAPSASPLTLAGYPEQQDAGSAMPGVPVDPRSSLSPPAQGENGLMLAAYPPGEPAPANTGPGRVLRSQAPTGVEQQSSLPLGVSAEFVCKAKVDHPPTEKGRIRGLLQCTGDRQILFSLRNIGPDQGVGVGKETENSGLLILFYHASLDEAWRRFPAVREDIRQARERHQ